VTLPRQLFLPMFDAPNSGKGYSVLKYLWWWNIFNCKSGGGYI